MNPSERITLNMASAEIAFGGGKAVAAKAEAIGTHAAAEGLVRSRPSQEM